MVGADKCLADDVGRNTRVFNNAFTPPPSARDRTPPRDLFSDPYAAYSGRANYEAFCEYERDQARQREHQYDEAGHEHTQRCIDAGRSVYVSMEMSFESSGDNWRRHTHSHHQCSLEQREEEDPTLRRSSFEF